MVSRADRKSMSVERYSPISFSKWFTGRTFSPISNEQEIKNILWSLCEALSHDLKEERTKGNKLTLKIKLANFQLRTKSRTLARHSWDAKEMFEAALKVFILDYCTECAHHVALQWKEGCSVDWDQHEWIARRRSGSKWYGNLEICEYSSWMSDLWGQTTEGDGRCPCQSMFRSAWNDRGLITSGKQLVVLNFVIN